MMYEEIHYFRGLMESTCLPNDVFLPEYFELYKSTVIWPPGLPPIRTCNIIEGSYMEKFHVAYQTALYKSDYELDNKEKTLIEKTPDSDIPS